MILAIPLTIPSCANLREHWAAKAKRAKAHRTAIALAMKTNRGLLELRAIAASGKQIRVTLIRVAPRKLDDDNLANAFKACRDEVAKRLGINDGSDAVIWVYKQQKPEIYGFRAGVMLIALPVGVFDGIQIAGKAPPGDERLVVGGKGPGINCAPTGAK